MNKFDAFVLALSRFIEHPIVAAIYDKVVMAPSRSYVDTCDDGPAAMARAVVEFARGGPKPLWLRNIDY